MRRRWPGICNQSGSGRTRRLSALNPSTRFHPCSQRVACSLDNGQAYCSFRFQQLTSKLYSSSWQVPLLITIRAPSSEAVTSCLILLLFLLQHILFHTFGGSTYKPLPRAAAYASIIHFLTRFFLVACRGRWRSRPFCSSFICSLISCLRSRAWKNTSSGSFRWFSQ